MTWPTKAAREIEADYKHGRQAEQRIKDRAAIIRSHAPDTTALEAEVAELRAKVESLNRQRDACCDESVRRDDKWMAGIEEACGKKLNFHPGFRNNAREHLPTLNDFISNLTAENSRLRKALEDVTGNPRAMAILERYAPATHASLAALPAPPTSEPEAPKCLTAP